MTEIYDLYYNGEPSGILESDIGLSKIYAEARLRAILKHYVNLDGYNVTGYLYNAYLCVEEFDTKEFRQWQIIERL